VLTPLYFSNITVMILVYGSINRAIGYAEKTWCNNAINMCSRVKLKHAALLCPNKYNQNIHIRAFVI